MVECGLCRLRRVSLDKSTSQRDKKAQNKFANFGKRSVQRVLRQDIKQSAQASGNGCVAALSTLPCLGYLFATCVGWNCLNFERATSCMGVCKVSCGCPYKRSNRQPASARYQKHSASKKSICTSVCFCFNHCLPLADCTGFINMANWNFPLYNQVSPGLTFPLCAVLQLRAFRLEIGLWTWPRMWNWTWRLVVTQTLLVLYSREAN